MKMEILNIQFTLVPLYNLVNISSLLFYYFFSMHTAENGKWTIRFQVKTKVY